VAGSDDFEKLQREFGVANCHNFEEEAGENKLVYTELFEKYSDLLEAAITDHLSAAVEGFDLMELVGMLNARKDELDGEVFDMMLTLTDFEAFKELMLAYKAETAQVRPAGLHSPRMRAAVGLSRGEHDN
jgi:ADP-ribosylation factor 2-binding protein